MTKPSNENASYQVEQMGPLTAWGELAVTTPSGRSMQGKGFLGQRLGLSSMEVSVNSLPAGAAYPFSHAHKKNEELYLFLSGSGEMLLDGKTLAVQPGTAVRVSPPVMRAWRNTGSEPLTCIVIQAKAGSLEEVTAGDGILAPEPPRWA